MAKPSHEIQAPGPRNSMVFIFRFCVLDIRIWEQFCIGQAPRRILKAAIWCLHAPGFDNFDRQGGSIWCQHAPGFDNFDPTRR